MRYKSNPSESPDETLTTECYPRLGDIAYTWLGKPLQQKTKHNLGESLGQKTKLNLDDSLNQKPSLNLDEPSLKDVFKQLLYPSLDEQTLYALIGVDQKRRQIALNTLFARRTLKAFDWQLNLLFCWHEHQHPVPEALAELAPHLLGHYLQHLVLFHYYNTASERFDNDKLYRRLRALGELFDFIPRPLKKNHLNACAKFIDRKRKSSESVSVERLSLGDIRDELLMQYEQAGNLTDVAKVQGTQTVALADRSSVSLTQAGLDYAELMRAVLHHEFVIRMHTTLLKTPTDMRNGVLAQAFIVKRKMHELTNPHQNLETLVQLVMAPRVKQLLILLLPLTARVEMSALTCHQAFAQAVLAYRPKGFKVPVLTGLARLDENTLLGLLIRQFNQKQHFDFDGAFYQGLSQLKSVRESSDPVMVRAMIELAQRDIICLDKKYCDFQLQKLADQKSHEKLCQRLSTLRQGCVIEDFNQKKRFEPLRRVFTTLT